jgi:transcriptional regulator with XRE-family HTH domain
MKPDALRIQLAVKNLSQAQLARALGVSKAQISYAINGKPGYAATRELIAEILNRPVEELWPPNVPAETD